MDKNQNNDGKQLASELTKKPKHKVALRGGFSDRMGIKTENKTIQIKEFDLRTRIQVINLITEIIYSETPNQNYNIQKFIDSTLSDVYQMEIDRTCSSDLFNFIPIITDTIRYDDYDSVLTLIEYLCNRINILFCPIQKIYNRFNKLFEQEYVGYRFVEELIIPISDQMEIDAIEEALSNASDEVRAHLQKALLMLSDRQDPDYENSIKESISAVEVECNILVGIRTTLGDALKKLEDNGIVIHPALKDAFIKLYGYTNDGKGIRHAGNLDGSNATFAEAKFMLIACCAFVNYLRINRAN